MDDSYKLTFKRHAESDTTPSKTKKHKQIPQDPPLPWYKKCEFIHLIFVIIEFINQNKIVKKRFPRRL